MQTDNGRQEMGRAGGTPAGSRGSIGRLKSAFCNLQFLILIACVAALVGFSGCGQTQRTITVTSEPSGALVYVNGEEKGRTPCSFDFLWYGDYRFQLVKEGYEKLDSNRNVRAMPNQWFPVDFVTEVFIPTTIRDEKHFHFELNKLAKANQEELINRGTGLREETLLKDR